MKAKQGAYLPYYREALALRSKLPGLCLEWIPREMNAGADELSKTGARKNVIGFALDKNVIGVEPPRIKKRTRTRNLVADIEGPWAKQV
jgi:ribonuclease HI